LKRIKFFLPFLSKDVGDMAGNASSIARSLAGNLAQADAAEKKLIPEATISRLF